MHITCEPDAPLDADALDAFHQQPNSRVNLSAA